MAVLSAEPLVLPALADRGCAFLMRALAWLLGRPLSTHEQETQQIGPLAGIPVLGLDALSSAAYGPEAALTLLTPLGMVGLRYLGPISALVIVALYVVYLSYRETISAYPGGSGSYTVAKENLGSRFALVAGAALVLDYILNVAVGISAGVGALVSMVPSLLPHTLALCLAILVLLTVINLRGARESGLAFMVPTYAFVLTLGAVIVVGVAKTLMSHGHPSPEMAPPAMSQATEAVGLWIVVRAFASGCTAMTGVEAVSNGVPMFRQPTVPLAQRTSTAIIAILVAFVGGIAYLSRAYGIVATPPGRSGYQSVLSMLTAAVAGRGAFYHVTLGSVVAVLSLSANTSFAALPRLCRVLAEDRYLPPAFAVRGRRLVFSPGIVVLAILSGLLLIAFGGITDRLIPLFASGAFLAFTVSQAGMVLHWRRVGGAHARRSLWLNGLGATATGTTLVVIAISRFSEGAWLTVVAVPLVVHFFVRVHGHYRHIERQLATIAPLEMPTRQSPIVVIAAGSWNKMTQRGLKFALGLSTDVHVVQVKTETDGTHLLSDNWELLIGNPARAAGIPQPKLIVLTSDYRGFTQPFVDYVAKLETENPQRDVVVVIPDVVMTRWYSRLLRNNRGMFLRNLLRKRCSSRVFIVDVPFHLTD